MKNSKKNNTGMEEGVVMTVKTYIKNTIICFLVLAASMVCAFMVGSSYADTNNSSIKLEDEISENNATQLASVTNQEEAVQTDISESEPGTVDSGHVHMFRTILTISTLLLTFLLLLTFWIEKKSGSCFKNN